MTSGIFHIVSMDDIVVRRDERQRRELSDIETLADSINRLGLIHPIVITRENELVAGERRFSACRRLGWTSIAAQYVDELEPATLRAIELEENIKRQDVPWQDQVRAVLEYHQDRVAEKPDWKQGDTAQALGIQQPYVSEVLMVGKGLAEGEKMIVEAPTFSTAKGIAKRALERREQAIYESAREPLGLHGIKIEGAPPPETIVTADFTEWVLGGTATRFNFLHVDFPYGIEADTFNQGGAASHGGYSDTREGWEKLMFALERATKDMVAQSAHIMFWFAMRKGDERLYEPTARRLEAIGWDINPLPLIWMKSDGVGIIPDPERGPRQIYETCLFGCRGDRKIVRAVANAYASPTVRDRHMSEKPEPMLRHFFSMFVDENTVMLDPTCGSGSALRAAESLSAKYVLGLEINNDFAELARGALKRARTLRKAELIVSE